MEQVFKISSRLKEWIKTLSLSFIILICIFILCLFVLFAVADMIFEDHDLAFDEKVFAAIHPYVTSLNTSIIQACTFLGSVKFLVPANVILILFFIIIKKERNNAWKVFLLVVSSTAVLFLLKSWLQRDRPLVPLISKVHGYSFPSGHTFSSVVFFGIICHLIYNDIKQPVIKWVLIIIITALTLLVGFSRIYLRVHYASDVIAGFLLGIIWLVMASWVLKAPMIHKHLPNGSV